MAQTYLFFQPVRLPLEMAELSETTLINLEDSPSLRANLERFFPGLAWQSQQFGQATVAGNWYELRLPQVSTETLALRCSLRTDHSAFVQDLCNQSGWLAFDGGPACFQPHHSPTRA